MATVKTINSDAAILSRAIQPERGDLSAEAAQSLLKITLDQRDLDRAHQLALKAQAGTLSDKEQEEIACYRRVGYLLSLLQSKARTSLKGTSSPHRPKA